LKVLFSSPPRVARGLATLGLEDAIPSGLAEKRHELESGQVGGDVRRQIPPLQK
jgi:hypothetical protein